MNIYKKLNAARAEFHTLSLKKTGLNKFAGYEYFELSDFLIPAMKVLDKHGLCFLISFGKELATMRIFDTDDGQSIDITSPMSTAALKGCHEVQNLGAVQSYLRRYLWVAALEIVEHDALDATTGKESAATKGKGPIISPLGTPIVDPARMSKIADVADAIKQHFYDGDIVGAFEEQSGVTDAEERIQMWKFVADSKVRAALKLYGEQLKQEAGMSRA